MNRFLKTLKSLWSLVVGLKITGVELWKPWLTVHYPRQEVDNVASFRGHIELRQGGAVVHAAGLRPCATDLDRLSDFLPRLLDEALAYPSA